MIKKIYSILALLCMAVSGACAQDPTIAVYFTDAKNWGDVKVYYWPNGGEWPGNDMTYVKDNEYNQKVYKAQVPANVEGIIFNGNGKQTVDITENIANNAWWYSDTEGGDGKFTVGYVGKYLAVDPTENPNEWTFEMPAYDVEVNVEYYPEATIATAPAATADVIAGTATELVSGGTAEGGTLMYQMTTTNEQPATLDGFSTTVPTAENITETGDVYVWYYVVGDAEHSDSEVAGPVAVPVSTVTYYVVGSMTDPAWTINTTYQLLPNTETPGEYYIHDMVLTAGTELKVVSSTDNGASIQYYYPDGTENNYQITRDATYSIYFRPDGQGGDGWHYGVIYAQMTAVTLDEAEDNAAVLSQLDGKVADLTLTRTLQAGGWNTVALPFSADAMKMATLAYSMGISAVKELSSATFADGVLTLNFQTATSLVAGKPYLVKVAANVANPTFTGVTVSKSIVPTETDVVDFIPTLGLTEITGENPKSVLFLGSGNTLLQPSGLPANMKGFRAYFQLKGDAANAGSFCLDLGDGETTGIVNIANSQEPTANGRYYDLQGRRLNSVTQKGVYIVNGKKTVIK